MDPHTCEPVRVMCLFSLSCRRQGRVQHLRVGGTWVYINPRPSMGLDSADQLTPPAPPQMHGTYSLGIQVPVPSQKVIGDTVM